MAKICKNKNPLVRGGTSQTQRKAAALQKDYVHIDEHSTSDLLLFAKKFAEHLKHYDTNNSPNGDWEVFFTEDVSIMIALIADTDLEKFDSTFKQLLKALVGAGGEVKNLYSTGLPSPTSLPSKLQNFKKLFDFIFSVASLLDSQIAKLKDESGLKDFAMATVQQQCTKALENLLGFYKVGIKGNNLATNDYLLINETDKINFPLTKDLPQRYTQDIIDNGLAKYWLNENDSWSLFYSGIDPVGYQYAYGKTTSSSMLNVEDVEQRIQPFISTISNIWQQLLSAYQRITYEAPRFLEETLENWPNHQPHIALYLGFIKLFRFAQDNLNSLKERHLNFYYKDVLRLKEKPATPDQVHLILELARQVEDHLLEKDNGLKAGKDSQGNEVQYFPNHETVLNKIKVSSLKAIYHTSSDGKTYSASQVDTLDGIEEVLISRDGQWNAFGPTMNYRGNILTGNPEPNPANLPVESTEETETYNRATTLREVGFAIASPNLFMHGGERTVFLGFNLSPTESPSFDSSGKPVDFFTVMLTGPKGWITVTTAVWHSLVGTQLKICLLYTSPSPRDATLSRMPSSA